MYGSEDKQNAAEGKHAEAKGSGAEGKHAEAKGSVAEGKHAEAKGSDAEARHEEAGNCIEACQFCRYMRCILQQGMGEEQAPTLCTRQVPGTNYGPQVHQLPFGKTS